MKIKLVCLLLAACLMMTLTGCFAPRAMAQSLQTVMAEDRPAVTLKPKAETAEASVTAAATLAAAATIAAAATPVPTPTPEITATPGNGIEVISVTEPTPDPEEAALPEQEAEVPETKGGQDVPKNGLTCYLTFDDGPSKNTEKILEVLTEKGVVATFFVVGDNAAKNPERILAIAAQGSCVANHTQTHDTDTIYQSAQALLKDLNAGRATLKAILGENYPADLMRFPYGSTNRRCRDYRGDVEAEGYRYFDWNALNGDAEHGANKRSTHDLYKQLKETVKDQYDRGNDVIVLMHDTNSKGTTVEMLGDAIDYIASLGYTFETLADKPMK